MKIEAMSGMVPGFLPFPGFFVVLTGMGLMAAAAAIIIGKKVKLAATLLAVELLSFALLVNLVAFVGGDQMAMGQVLKDMGLAGSALLYAGLFDKNDHFGA